MIVERTKSEILIRVSAKVNTYGLQRIMDYLKYLELTADSNARLSDGGIIINNDSYLSENCVMAFRRNQDSVMAGYEN